MKGRQKVGIWALILGLIALSFSACTSAPSGAPITYAGHAPPRFITPMTSSRALPLPSPAAAPAIAPAAAYWLATPRLGPTLAASECVPFVRNASGVQIWGDAYTWWDQAAGRYRRSNSPADQAVIVLRGWKDNKRGHVAVVKRILGSRLIQVDHANWMHGGEVSLDVPVADVSFANDWSEVRVWHIPGAHWGGRTYQVQGFIHELAVAPPGSDKALIG